MDAMYSLNEVFGCEGKASALGMPTYGELEGAVNFQYHLDMTVSAKVDNLSLKAEKKLVCRMKKTLGYSKCDIDKLNNTIYLYSIDGVVPLTILEYIRSHIDPEAR